MNGSKDAVKEDLLNVSQSKACRDGSFYSEICLFRPQSDRISFRVADETLSRHPLRFGPIKEDAINFRVTGITCSGAKSFQSQGESIRYFFLGDE